MATKLPTDLTLSPLGGKARDLNEWLTTFHLASVVLDPYTNESSWILKTAVRVLDALRGSHARVNFIVTANADDSPSTHPFGNLMIGRILVDRQVMAGEQVDDCLKQQQEETRSREHQHFYWSRSYSSYLQ